MVTDYPQIAEQCRQAEKGRKQKEALQASAAKFIASLALLPLRAWILMLVLGAVHGVVVVVPAVSYGTALLFLLGIDLLTDATRKFRK